MELDSLYARKTLTSAVALSLVLSGCLLVGSGSASASAAGSFSLSAKGQQVQRYASLKDLQNRWRKQAVELHKAGPHFYEETAQILGIEKAALTDQLKSGKSIVDIAKEKGISETTLLEKIMAGRSAKLEEAVQGGKLTRERADTIKTKMQSHLAQQLKHKGLFEEEPGHPHSQHKRGDMIPHLGPEKLSGMLGMSKDELVAQLKTGKSLAEIAAEKGISKDELIAKIKDELTPALEKAIERKPPLAKENKEKGKDKSK
jgi:lambda repressor-like predicted transcriptional regulator